MEQDFLDWLLPRLPDDPRLEVGPGDDAAVLRPPAGRRTVVSVDMLSEGVDFRLGPECHPRQIGHKGLAVGLSDLAAMGARPEAAVVAVCLPRVGGGALARDIAAGVAALAATFDVAIAGGDTNAWDGGLVVSVTVLGSVEPGHCWRRDGARPGDAIIATGRFGGSILGRHLDVQPRCREAAWIAARYPVHAAIDVSDGLSLDLARMMKASGTGALLDLAAVPIHPDAARLSLTDGLGALEHALADGEDFELLLTLPSAAAAELLAARWPFPVALTRIGTVTAGQGLSTRAADGSEVPLAPRGFIHAFAD